MTENGDFDYHSLENKLKELKDCLKIGSFSAGSNLTGQYFDMDRIAFLCHKYGALAFFDCACVGPYLEINMNGTSKNGFT